MSRAAMVTAVAAAATAAGALFLALGAHHRAADAEAGANALRSSLDAARTRIEEVERESSASAAALRASEERSASLASRVAALETRGLRAAAATAAAGPAGGEGGGDAAAASSSSSSSSADPAAKAEFLDLRRRFFKGEATTDEQKRYWELARTEGFLDGVIADAEAAVASDPDDLAARMELSQDYVARLFTVPAGPEMGVWAAKAESQWKEVLARDDRHWEARMSLATSWSRYPDFLNKTPDAIREFETLRRQQEAGPVEARQSRVYLELSNLYKRAGSPEKQRAALEDGLRRHPDDEELKKAMEIVAPR